MHRTKLNQSKLVGEQNNSTEHYGMTKVCVPTRNLFKKYGCIKEERVKQREQTKMEVAVKQEASKLAKNQRIKATIECKRRRKLVKITRGNNQIAHRDFLSIQPPISAMRQNTIQRSG
jgi:hypothetical protein